MTYIKLCGQSRICASHSQAMSFIKTEQAMSANIKLEKNIYYSWSITFRAVDFPIKIHFSLKLFVVWVQLFRMTHKIEFFSCTVCVKCLCTHQVENQPHSQDQQRHWLFLGALFERTLYPWFEWVINLDHNWFSIDMSLQMLQMLIEILSLGGLCCNHSASEKKKKWW